MKPQTAMIHGMHLSESSTNASALPICMTAAFSYPTAEALENVFRGRSAGDIYTRISNPTTQHLEQRLCALECGAQGPATGCIVTASGMAAITATFSGLLRSGDQIVSSSSIFGGTHSLFNNTLSRFGITTTFVDSDDPDAYASVLHENTRAIFVETIGNPRMNVSDIEALARLADDWNIPLVVDATLTPPPLAQMGARGAHIVIHSTSKFINGYGTAIGGALIDTGNYDWRKGKFSDLRELAHKAGAWAFLAYLRKTIHRDLGGCASPMNSFLMLQGLQTLSPRMDLHCRNALKLAEFLQQHPEVAWVNYPGLQDSPYMNLVTRLFGGKAGGVLTFGLGDPQRSRACINSFRLAKNMTNLGDAKTLVLHPATTIFCDHTREERNQAGAYDDAIRVSVGIEDIDDIIGDFEQAIAKAALLVPKCEAATQGKESDES